MKSITNHICLPILILLIVAINSKLVIQTPTALKQYFQKEYGDAGIPYSIANFGITPYGKTIAGQVAIPSVLSDCVIQDLDSNPAKKKIVLVERNDCTFTQKAHNVMKEGGKLAMIMDNTIQQPGKVVMVDDGKGIYVGIATILISQKDGQKMLQYLTLGQSVVARINFQTNLRERAQIKLWLDIDDRKNLLFLRNFYPFYKKIQSHVDLSIAYPTNPCSWCVEENCYYNFTYCRNPKNSLAENAGRQLINQQLRQFVLFQTNPAKWWEYMFQFDEECYDLAIMEECSKQVMEDIGVKSNKIQKTVTGSFKTDSNPLLSDFQKQRAQSSIVFFPSIVVNGIVYRGHYLEPIDVFELVCTSLIAPPQECNMVIPVAENNVWLWIMIGIISFTVFVIFIIACYRRFIRRKLSQNINKQVNELVNQYITMYQSQKFNEEPPKQPK